MRISALPLLVILSTALVSIGCHDTASSSQPQQPGATQVAAVQPPPQAPGQAIAETPSSTPPPVQPAPPPPRPKPRQSAQDIAQLDLGKEGGVRDGSYAMWVHVAAHGKPVKSLRVVAYKSDDKPAAAARTNQDGDAMLKVQATTYRITATEGPLHAEQTVTFHPGDQYELDLEH